MMSKDNWSKGSFQMALQSGNQHKSSLLDQNKTWMSRLYESERY